MPEVKENEVPILFVELVDKQDSGFIKDGTENTPFEERLTAPSISWIPTEGFRKGVKIEVDKKSGKKVETKFNERIRFIRNEEEISLQRQKELGIEPSNMGKGDKIIFEKGFATIARDNQNAGLYDYILQSFYNQSNPERSQRATAIYKVIEKDKEAEIGLENDIAIADALKYVQSLVQKIGKNQYKYNEEKLNGLCELFSIYGESNAVKIQALSFTAKRDAKEFMKLVSKWENLTVTEITQAINLNVIGFDENIAIYKTKEKVIYSLGTEALKHEQKISKLADWLRTSDGHEAYMELKAELEAAKEKLLQ